MKNKFISYSILTLQLLVSTVSAETAPAPIPNNIKAGSQYYDASVSGISEYMLNLKKTNLDAYNSLKPKLDSLQTKKTISILTTAGLASAAAFFYVGSVSFLQTDNTNTYSTGKSVNTTAMSLGLGLTAAAFASYWILSPSRRDIMEFVNEHNRVTPKEPLNFQIGFDPSQRNFMLGLNYSF